MGKGAGKRKFKGKPTGPRHFSTIEDMARSTARLECGHRFHLDCIGSAFNAKGFMQCPNCRHVENGRWLFALGPPRDGIHVREALFPRDEHNIDLEVVAMDTIRDVLSGFTSESDGEVDDPMQEEVAEHVVRAVHLEFLDLEELEEDVELQFEYEEPFFQFGGEANREYLDHEVGYGEGDREDADYELEYGQDDREHEEVGYQMEHGEADRERPDQGLEYGEDNREDEELDYEMEPGEDEEDEVSEDPTLWSEDDSRLESLQPAGFSDRPCLTSSDIDILVETVRKEVDSLVEGEGMQQEGRGLRRIRTVADSLGTWQRSESDSASSSSPVTPDRAKEARSRLRSPSPS